MTGLHDASVTAEQFAQWCAHLFEQRHRKLACTPADMNAPAAAGIYDPHSQFRVFADVRDAPAQSPPKQRSGGAGGWPWQLPQWPKWPTGDQRGKGRCFVWIICWGGQLEVNRQKQKT